MKLYCIGIGGIGLSALARYYKHKGWDVAGSDAADSELVQTLKQEGIDVIVGASADRITEDIDMVAYTIAIPLTQPELVRAKELSLVCKTYPEALGDITKEKKTIAVCGTHGKTTTTAMVYHALKSCGINPTVIVGSLLSGVGTNFIAGNSEYMVVEACEYRRSFLNLHPSIILVTNIDADHLDYYKDIYDIHDAFQEFARLLPKDGELIAHKSEFDGLEAPNKIFADAYMIHNLELSVIGEHNKKNAQLVIALGNLLRLDSAQVRMGLKEFKGTWRRLEYKGKTQKGAEVYDDYGHHPTEIRATIEALREKYRKRSLHIFFQPHLYSRTKLFLSSFADVLNTSDHVYLMPIYAAREEDDGTITSEMLAQKIRDLGGNVTVLESKLALAPTIEAIDDPNAIVVNIGAGDAYAELSKLYFV